LGERGGDCVLYQLDLQQIGLVIAGIIVAGKTPPGNPLGQKKQIASSELGMDLQKARHDPNVKAVVLRVDSPGQLPFPTLVNACALYMNCVLSHMSDACSPSYPHL